MVLTANIPPCSIPLTVFIAFVDEFHYVRDHVLSDQGAILFSMRLGRHKKILRLLIPSKGLQDIISSTELFL